MAHRLERWIGALVIIGAMPLRTAMAPLPATQAWGLAAIARSRRKGSCFIARDSIRRSATITRQGQHPRRRRGNVLDRALVATNP